MAIVDYGTLKTAVENWRTRPDSFITARIPEYIALAESRLFNDLRVREMEARATITTTIAQREDTFPTRRVQDRALYISGTGRLELRSPAEFWTIYQGLATASPAYYTIVGESYAWAPVPDAAYSIVVDHYAKMAAFSSDSDTNAVIARWPGLYLYASLMEAAIYVSDNSSLMTNTALYESLLEQAHAADARDRYSGDPVNQQRQAGMT